MPITKYHTIVEYIRSLILEGTYRTGDRLPSDGQLLRKFKTSRPTVAKAMKQLEDEGYLERRVGAGSFVTFSVQSRPHLIGLLTPEIGEAELFEPLCSQIARSCQKNGLSLLWPDSSIHQDLADHHERVANQLCQRFIQQQVAGVFFAPVEFSERMVRINREIAKRLDENGVSVILLDRDLERSPKRSRFDWVGIDNFRAGFVLAEYLINLGCKKIAYVARLSSAPTIELRIAGFERAIAEHGLSPKDNKVVFGNVKQPSFVKKLNPEKFDGVVCSNDTTAVYLLQTLINAGIKVPEDLRLVGVDDVKLSEHAPVKLTTLQQPFRLMGVAAVDAMISRIENRSMPSRNIFLDFKIIVRDSCGARTN